MVSTQLLKGGNIQTSPYHQYCIYSKAEIKLFTEKRFSDKLLSVLKKTCCKKGIQTNTGRNWKKKSS